MTRRLHYSLDSFFAPLDAGFINIESDNQPFVWQTTDFVVQSAFELPIPTSVGSLINFCKYRSYFTYSKVNFTLDM